VGWRVGLAGLLGVTVLAGCSPSRRTANGSDGAASGRRQQTVTVSAQTIRPVIIASGKVVPRQIVNLSPKVSGRLVALYVDQGVQVRKGQVIARMDDQEVQADVAEAKANLAQAQAHLDLLRAGNRPEEIAQAGAQVRAAKARMQQSARLKKANDQLLAGDFVAADQAYSAATDLQTNQAMLEEAEKRYALLKAGSRAEEIAQARAQVDQARARLQSARVRLQETEIRAPFDGLITQKYASVGAFVTPTTSASGSSSATSTSIVALAGALEILAKVPEVEISELKLGQTADIVSDAFPRFTFHGHVRLIAPEAVIEQNVTSFECRLALDDGLDRLRSGMSVDANFTGRPIPNALVVPSVSITTKDRQVGVWVLDTATHQPEFRTVTVGTTSAGQSEIVQGLQAGERVFISQPIERAATGFNPMRMLGFGRRGR
jgi:HlyD family secretion protein